MSRISSQGSLIMISDDLKIVQGNLTSATKASPCTVTLTAATDPPPVVGDTVIPRGTFWKSLDDQPFRVSAIAGLVLTLEDSDTTNEITPDILGSAKLDFTSWLELCRSNFNANSPAGATIDVTTLCDNAHKIVAGLPAIGTWTAAGFYDVNDFAMFRARDCYRSGEKMGIQVVLADGSGWVLLGIVNQFDLTLGLNAAVANNIGGQIDGRINFFKTPPTGFVPSIPQAA
jgi:hypothetical protein